MPKLNTDARTLTSLRGRNMAVEKEVAREAEKASSVWPARRTFDLLGIQTILALDRGLKVEARSCRHRTRIKSKDSGRLPTPRKEKLTKKKYLRIKTSLRPTSTQTRRPVWRILQCTSTTSNPREQCYRFSTTLNEFLYSPAGSWHASSLLQHLEHHPTSFSSGSGTTKTPAFSVPSVKLSPLCPFSGVNNANVPYSYPYPNYTHTSAYPIG